VKTAVLLAKAWMRSDLSEKNLRKAQILAESLQEKTVNGLKRTHPRPEEPLPDHI